MTLGVMHLESSIDSIFRFDFKRSSLPKDFFGTGEWTFRAGAQRAPVSVPSMLHQDSC
jgi:hypothetical protein